MYADLNNVVISKLIKTKTKFKDSIGYLDKVMRPLVLIFSKTFKVKDGDKNKNNKLTSLDVDNNKPLEKLKKTFGLRLKAY